jgi:uncharacterized protein (DUF952 family)
LILLLPASPFLHVVLNGPGAADRVRPAADETALPTIIFKICDASLWRESERDRDRVFRGAAVDRQDGYIHFSSAEQVAETAARHFAGADNLLLVAVEAQALGPALRWEPSRGGALFPHLHGVLPLAAVRWVKPLPLGPDGRHIFPELTP